VRGIVDITDRYEDDAQFRRTISSSDLYTKVTSRDLRRAQRGQNARREAAALQRSGSEARGLPQFLAERPGKTLVLCDSLDRGRKLAEDLDAPFVSGETRDRMAVFQDPDHRVVIGSRVADEGLSLADLGVVVEYDFHGGSRRQEAQRYGRVMHGESTGEHLILMTDAEYESIASACSRWRSKGSPSFPSGASEPV
jgi:superfamily II DNA or RNA helicase